MKTLYLECKMGVAGDMLTAALISLFDNPKEKVQELNAMHIPDVEYILEETEKCGIKGKYMKVLVHGQEEMDSHERCDSAADDHHHHHHSLYDIEEIIENMEVNKDVKSDVREVYQMLAEAEGKVHGKPVSAIHFHEVGDLDAIADVTAVCYLIHELDPDKIIVSPINVGSGTVKCAHGILPVPAPATAVLLSGIPSYESKNIEAELCTPTGAALVKYFSFEFSVQPTMYVQKIGYGMGKKDFQQANCLRAVLGDSIDDTEQIVELSCNIDDMTPEEIGYATEHLMEAGAVDVYTMSIGMKKNRPGILLSCMCGMDKREKMIREIFKNTTTIGVRETICNRYVLSREIKKVDTPYGKVRIKHAYGYGVDRKKAEYEDLSSIARITGKSIINLKKEVEE